jgi:hypothetical protein
MGLDKSKDKDSKEPEDEDNDSDVLCRTEGTARENGE